MPKSKRPRKHYRQRYDVAAPSVETSHTRALLAIEHAATGKCAVHDMNALIDVCNRFYALIKSDTKYATEENNDAQMLMYNVLMAIRGRSSGINDYSILEEECALLGVMVDAIHELIADISTGQMRSITAASMAYTRKHGTYVYGETA